MDEHRPFNSNLSNGSNTTEENRLEFASEEYLRDDSALQDSFYSIVSESADNEFASELGLTHVQREDDEAENPQLDDAVKESTALSIYKETHPDHEQFSSGGREVADHEAIWSVSTFRPPHWGPDKLRDNNALTYWQSDCPNPRLDHTIDISFHKATYIRQVSLFIDFFQDESYTPKTVVVRGGLTFRDLQEISRIECSEVVGWINMDITSVNDNNPFRLFYLQIAILSTHLNGRDTHIRQLKVYSEVP
ncbi:anaphase-promoting complex, subunit 10-domain-containing protein [Gilbertella persicaria]|uniref:anaphase-promoting complex, subunit 10-domain-containing protein n=1 Tax=Gilbertella persicaria TaxID=101096 RepID=UPI00221E920C|nr:anaphase-promoting complex, subunit 10-domain-containing protein [Gilbertella persicaria]KAI8080254.1 anaphase-promoting complex, subunit 10-domain-containing protein [Gilbertella persicaria]